MIVIPVEQWLIVKPEVFSDPGSRSAAQYIKCIEQFPVTTHARWQRNAQGRTACNIFAYDVSVAMKVPCPHWVDKTTRDPLALGPTGIPVQKENRLELSGNGICHWLQTTGVQKYGWRFCTLEEAAQNASKGFMTVATWFNPGPDGLPFTNDDGIGHIGVIRPSVFPNVRMAQAGASNFLNGSVANGFGTNPKIVNHMVYLTHS